MPTLVACPACGRQLRVPDNVSHRRAKCPQCGGAVPLGGAAPPSGAATSAISFAEPTPPAADQVLDVRTSGKPKRKKKRRRKAETASADHTWLWPWCALAGLVGACGIAAVAFAAAGYADDVLFYAVWVGVMLPVSAVILLVAMLISSHLAGGMNFGELRTAIPKALCLLLLVNLIGLVRFGIYLALPVWLVGLMYLFDLDLWESRFLVAINWILNFLFKWLVLMTILSALIHGKPGLGDDDKTLPPPGVQQDDDEPPDLNDAPRQPGQRIRERLQGR